jgi:hypothetical protein
MDNNYVLFSKDGKKRLGEFPSRDKAMMREKEMNKIEHMKKGGIPKKKK